MSAQIAAFFWILNRYQKSSTTYFASFAACSASISELTGFENRRGDSGSSIAFTRVSEPRTKL